MKFSRRSNSESWVLYRDDLSDKGLARILHEAGLIISSLGNTDVCSPAADIVRRDIFARFMPEFKALRKGG